MGISFEARHSACVAALKRLGGGGSASHFLAIRVVTEQQQ